MKTVPSTTVAGIKRYLSGGLVKGIGPVLAKKLVGSESPALFQFYKEQYENRPHPDRHWKQHHGRVSLRSSSRKQVRQHHHGESSEHSKNKSSPVHTCSARFLVCTPEDGKRLYTYCPSPP